MNKSDIHNAIPLTDRQSKLPLLYFTIMISIMHICNVMAFKTLVIFGFIFSFTGLFFPMSFLLLTALTESYGHVEAERHIFYILLGQTILIGVVSLAVRIDIATGGPVTQQYYDLYKHFYRLIISSNLSVGLSYYFTSALNSKFKCWLLGKMWWTRFLIANGIGQVIIVCVAYPVNFYDILPWWQILEICVNTWLFKMCLVLILLLIAPVLVRMNRRIDHIEVYDFNILYNPIKMYKDGNYGKNYFHKRLRKSDHR